MSFHHKSIKRFELEGTIHDDAHINRLKIEYMALLILGMKTDGYVPQLDLDPDFTIEYLGNRGYHFKMSVYGVFLGKKRAQEVDALTGYKPRYAPGVDAKESAKKTV